MIPGVDPNDVWLSDGSLLVLKGGITDSSGGFDNPWPMLDDYEAAYREPVLAPNNILQKDVGKFAGVFVVTPSKTTTTTTTTTTPKPPPAPRIIREERLHCPETGQIRTELLDCRQRRH